MTEFIIIFMYEGYARTKEMIFEMEKIVLLRFNFSNLRLLVAIGEKFPQCEGFFHENQTRITGH